MFPYAMQLNALPLRQMDNATELSYMHQVYIHGMADTTMQAKMGQWWTDFAASYLHYDQVVNPARRSLLTEDLKGGDDERDNALGAYHEALLGLQRNPNAEKRQAARLLLLNFDSFAPDRSQEYMKETELIDQLLKEQDGSQEMTAAVALLGLGDYVTDLKAKNDAFAATMSDRTASTQGQEKGAVAAARADLEEKFQLFRRMLNVASTYEGDSDYRAFLLAVNAEVEHFRQILARKGVSTSSGSNSNGANGQNGNNNGGETPTPDPGTGGETPDPGTGGGETPVNPDPGTGGGDTPGGGGGSNPEGDDEN